jgi:hypothetical protein
MRWLYLLLPCVYAILPLSTSGPNLVDPKGNRIVYSGVNWPGHLDAMIPEGLQFRSVAQIVTTIKSLGMNVVRLTYATEMVDEALAGRSDAKAGFTRALGERNGQAVWRNITQRNGWHDGITRLQVFRIPTCVSIQCSSLHFTCLPDIRRCCRRMRAPRHHGPSGQPHLQSHVVLRQPRRQLVVWRQVFPHRQLGSRMELHGEPCKHTPSLTHSSIR